MIEVLKDDKGDIVAVCEWLLFNEDKFLDDKGTLVCISELEINKAYRGNGVIKKFIRNIQAKCPTAQRMFFWRENKYPARPFRVYSRKQILRRMGRE